MAGLLVPASGAAEPEGIQRSHHASRRVAVVVPLYRSWLSADEQLSLFQLNRHLRRYPCIALAPKGLELPYLDQRFIVERFDARLFRGIRAYNELLLSRELWERLKDFEFVLIYQLDALVLSDQLEAWCSRDFDYIGAPWFEGFASPMGCLFGVGNGGFSLRKVGSALAFLENPTFAAADLAAATACPHLSRSLQGLRRDALLRPWRRRLDPVRYLTRDYRMHEDLFWSMLLKHLARSWKLPDVSEALRFSFEVEPRRCFELSGGSLPFGCHGWARYDRDFWLEALSRS